MFMITYTLNGVRNSLCVRCSVADTAVEAVDGNAIIESIEKLY